MHVGQSWPLFGHSLHLHYALHSQSRAAGVQSILVELYLTTLFSEVSLNFFNKTTLITHAGASISVTVRVMPSKCV